MEKYEKGECKEVEHEKLSFTFHPSCIHMKVNNGSKIKNLMGFAMSKTKDDNVRQISWSGSGTAVTKVLSCAEILKRKVKGLHQISDIYNKRVEEYWEPKIEGLERLRVNKDVPAITILLSKDKLDTSHPSYQSPTQREAFWMQSPQKRPHQDKRGPRQTRFNKNANKDATVPMVRLSKKEYKKEKKPHNKQQGQAKGGKVEQQEKYIVGKGGKGEQEKDIVGKGGKGEQEEKDD